MRRPPKVHVAFPGVPKSSRHIGRTYAFCFAWAHDTHVREFGRAHGAPYMPRGVDCQNCWSRWKRTLKDGRKLYKMLAI
jgi:hypothetical protein